MVICPKEHRRGTSRFTILSTHGLPQSSFSLTSLCVVLQIRSRTHPTLKNRNKKSVPPKKEKQNKKTHQLIAGALLLVRSRSQQSPVTVRLAEPRCAREQEQGQVEQLEEARIAEARTYHRSWPEVSECLGKGKSCNPSSSTSYPKTPYTKGHMQKATSKGNTLVKTCANCNLFLWSCYRQPRTACVCKSCSHFLM